MAGEAYSVSNGTIASNGMAPKAKIDFTDLLLKYPAEVIVMIFFVDLVVEIRNSWRFKHLILPKTL